VPSARPAVSGSGRDGEEGLDLSSSTQCWQNDIWLRDGFRHLEGEALAVVRRDGNTTLFLDSALEAERASSRRRESSRACARELEHVEALLMRAGIRAAPHRRSAHPANASRAICGLRFSDGTALTGSLLMVKLGCRKSRPCGARRTWRWKAISVSKKPRDRGVRITELVAEVEASSAARCRRQFIMISAWAEKRCRAGPPPMGKRLKRGDPLRRATPASTSYYLQICRTLSWAELRPISTRRSNVYREASLRASPREAPV